jgi:ferredoxin
MEMEVRTIGHDTLERLFTRWREAGKRILAPKKIAERIDFAAVDSLAEVSLDQVQTVQSPKAVVFPRVEELLSFRRTLAEVDLRARASADLPETIVFGLRPCDAAAFASLSAIFNWDSPDRLFSARMKKTTLVGVACARADEYCFCTSVGGGPGSVAGSDVLLTAVGQGELLVETISEKGRDLLGSASDISRPGSEPKKEDHLARVGPAFQLDRIRPALDALFADESFWTEQSLRCLGCGACAYVCPACACFDIQDEGGDAGKRLRCWDSCGFALFTLHTSGHNPRPRQNVRWRQRLMHKFSYMPERLQVLGCVGCGRCSRTCPVDMDVREHLQAVAEAKP